MTQKQKLFVEEYLKDLNATQASIRAGFSKKTARVSGTRLLADAAVRSAIDRAIAERSERNKLSADFVLEGLKEVALRCLQQTPVMTFDYANKTMVQKTDGDGNGVYEFDSNGANKAFELLGKHLGIFAQDNRQKNPETKPLTPDQAKDLVAELRKLSPKK